MVASCESRTASSCTARASARSSTSSGVASGQSITDTDRLSVLFSRPGANAVMAVHVDRSTAASGLQLLFLPLPTATYGSVFSIQSRLSTSELTLENAAMLLNRDIAISGHLSLKDAAMDTTWMCEKMIFTAVTTMLLLSRTGCVPASVRTLASALGLAALCTYKAAVSEEDLAAVVLYRAGMGLPPEFLAV